MERAGNKKNGASLMVLPVAANAEITQGTMVALNASGYAVPAAKATGLVVVGCAMETVLGSATAGEITVKADRAVYVWDNDNVTAADLLKKCYVKDAKTVTATATGSSVAGTILAVDADGVTVLHDAVVSA